MVVLDRDFDSATSAEMGRTDRADGPIVLFLNLLANGV